MFWKTWGNYIIFDARKAYPIERDPETQWANKIIREMDVQLVELILSSVNE